MAANDEIDDKLDQETFGGPCENSSPATEDDHLCKLCRYVLQI